MKPAVNTMAAFTFAALALQGFVALACACVAYVPCIFPQHGLGVRCPVRDIYPGRLQHRSVPTAVMRARHSPSATSQEHAPPPLSTYISHFNVSSAVRVSQIPGKGWGLRAVRDIAAGQTIVAVPRHAVIEVCEKDECPWGPALLNDGVVNSDAESVWRALPLFLRLALALLQVAASAASAAEDARSSAGGHEGLCALKEYLDLLPHTHDGALAWSDEELLELQV
jgi:hypothetical protein